MKSGIEYRVSGIGGKVPWVVLVLFVFSPAVNAQHLRIYACAIANDSAGAFMGGSSNGSGLYQSDDTGKTWKHLGWDNIKCYSMDEVESSNGRILFEATGLGILRSTDYGAHWKQLTDWRISEAMDVAVNQKYPDEIYIATAHGAWQTSDGGNKWIEKISSYCEMVNLDGPGLPKWYNETIDILPNWRDRLSLLEPDADLAMVSIVGSLGKGDLLSFDSSDEGVRIFDYYEKYSSKPLRRLIYCQIWTLKSFLVTP
ncbi:MAG: WD40/YVTN/BNR-like repeat-containing protein [Candidatus Kapaibacterium sp.]